MSLAQELTRQSIRSAISAIELSMEDTKSMESLTKNKKQYLQEFCTLDLNFPRRSGKTTSIVQIVNEKFPNALVLFPTIDRCIFAVETLKIGKEKVRSFRQFSVDDVNSETSAIFIDESMFFDKYDELYNVVATLDEPIMICFLSSPHYQLATEEVPV